MDKTRVPLFYVLRMQNIKTFPWLGITSGYAPGFM